MKSLKWPGDFIDKVVVGDCVDVMRQMPDESVNCCVTSPPYWGLRDYGVEGQLGLEKTPEEFVGKMVAVFREVRRVLRGDGTLWLNLGDSYANKRGNTEDKPGFDNMAAGDGASLAIGHNRLVSGLKNKDLCGMPWRVAFALQADGWYLRRDIIWSKPNPMPESVTDRPTTAHEYVFLMAKSERYFYDADAVREPAEFGVPNSPKSIKPPHGQGFTRRAKSDPLEGSHGVMGHDGKGRRYESVYSNEKGRNRRSVWHISTIPFSEAHFATFPPKLIEPCILAGSAKGGIILDPFGGAGTTSLVAAQHGRKSVSIELNPEYAKIARKRIKNEQAQGKLF